MHYVYILTMKGSRIYTGYTQNIRRRVAEHKQGKVRSTNKLDPILIFYEAYLLKSDAERREKFLKTTEGKKLLKQQLRDYFDLRTRD